MASSETATAVTGTIPHLPNHKVKIKKTGQRACNEKNDKGKFCGGHLKRWFYYRRRARTGVRLRGESLGAGRRSVSLRKLSDALLAQSRRSAWDERCGSRPAFGIRANGSAQGREKGVASLGA